MDIKVINCKDLLHPFLIEEISNKINTYNYGFMLIDSNLYLPYYQVLRGGFIIPDSAVTHVINLADVTKFDRLSIRFKCVDTIDICDIIDLWKAMQLDDDFDQLLAVVDNIATAKYELGYSDSEI